MPSNTKYSEQQALNITLDEIAGISRVTLFPATSKRLIDSTTTTNVVYIGVAAAGTSTNITQWLIEKIDSSSSTISFTHATDAWDNRATTASYT